MTAEKCRELLLAVIKGFRELSNLMTGKTVRGQQWQPGSLYLENRILKNQKSNIQIERSERRDKTSEDDRNVVDERSSKQQRYRDISVLYVKRKETLWRHKGKSEGSHEEVTETLQQRDCNAMQSGLFQTRMVKHKERRVDALALRADERRDKLRKASGSCK